MNGFAWLRYDLRHAVRSLFKDRGSVVLALLALSLGIAATTVIFSVVYSVFINAFPFSDSSRVVHFFIHAPDRPGRSAWYPAPEFAEYRAQNHVFSDVLGGVSLEALYSLENSTYRVRGAFLDTGSLRALGLRPRLGREISDADGAPGAPPTFLISDRLWHERFNRDPNVLGMTVKVNGTMRTLIAVLPPRFLLHGADIFFPMRFTADATPALFGGPSTDPLYVWTYARLKPGVSLPQAAADIDVIARNQARLHPDRYPKQFSVTVSSLADVYTSQDLKEMVYILSGAVFMLLMIACSNVANLLLARAASRRAELALRASLGASRGRLMQLLLAESFALAVIATAIGGLLAYLGIQWVRTAIPAAALPSEMEIRFSREALWATIGVTLLTTLLCGLAPALTAGRGNLQSQLMGSGKGTGLRSGRGGMRAVLVAIQVTLAIVLLVGAGLMMRTLLAIQHIDPGLNPRNVLVGQLAFPVNQAQTLAQKSLFLQRVLERVRALPGVAAASPAVGVPLRGGPNSALTIAGTTPTAKWRAVLDFVGDEYFRVVGLPLINGRLLSADDVEGARNVTVVNQQFVQEFLAGADPIGRTVVFAAVDRGAPGKQTPFEIVGVVGDARNGGLQEPVRPQAFLPYTAPGFQAGLILLRTTVTPESLQHAVRQGIWAVDQDVGLTHVAGAYGTLSLEQILYRDAMAAPAFGVGLLGTFAAIGLILSAIGVFSVIAYTVSLQTHDIGIRLALGAEPGGVMRLIVLKGLRPIAAGVLLGTGASYALTRLLESHIYGVTTTDPLTFSMVVVVLIGVGLFACILPARRAMRVDPLVALRSE